MNLNILNSVIGAPMDMPAPLGFDNWLTFWMVLIVSLVNAIMLSLAGYKILQIIQLSGYKIKGFFIWLKDTKFAYIGRLVILSFLSSAALLITNVLLEDFFVYKIMTYLGLIFYFLFLTIFVINMYQSGAKVPLKYTHRMNRLIAITGVVIFVISFISTCISAIYTSYFRFGALGLTPVFLPLFIIIAFYITLPFENFNNKKYINKAKKKLELHEDLIVIGITGSYGKTSVKNILNTMLSAKYSVCATPYSFNTPLGLAKTVLDTLKKQDKILIAEMGARNKGDISYLCDIVKPQIAVITGIGNQHLSTFGSLENLMLTKEELIKALPEKGKAFINTDSNGAKLIYDRTNVEKYSINSIENGFAVAKDIKCDSNGSKFTLEINSEKIDCETKLIGKHNISNILLCAGVAYSMGLTLSQISVAITMLQATAHRLAIIPSSNSLVVIDDAYNGSVEGAKAAIDVLALFKGKKIVITPGLVELGEEEFNSNFEFGIYMSKIADFVIIDGISAYEAISNGLAFGGFDESKIFRASSVKQAVDLLETIAEPNDVILFENDLPDNYA
ncbi:MAG: UDP-N-acetylmuramoyl-tripeptide--D-alanyl-D-alanine ligase [Clostridia bacterium]